MTNVSSMYTTGRIVANFMQKALDTQSYALAMRYRADLTTIQSCKSSPIREDKANEQYLVDMVSSMSPPISMWYILTNRHTLGGAMSEYLNTCLNKNAGGTDPTEVLKAIDNGQCLDPSQANSFPVPPRSYDGLPPVSLAASGSNTFLSNTAQFQEKVHMEFTSNGMDQGVDMSTYLTQMSMGTNNNFDNTNTNQYLPNGKGNEAHISPLSYNNPLSNNSGSSSYASSRNFSGSSKTTPESSGLVDPQPNYFDNNIGNVNGSGKGSGDSMGYMIYGQEEQGQGQGQNQNQTRFGQMERYFDTIPNQDSKMY